MCKEKLCLCMAGDFKGFIWWLVFVAHLIPENQSFALCHLCSGLLKERSWWTGLDPSFVMFSLTCSFEPLFGSRLICRWCQPPLENQLTSAQSKEALFQGQLWKRKMKQVRPSLRSSKLGAFQLVEVESTSLCAFAEASVKLEFTFGWQNPVTIKYDLEGCSNHFIWTKVVPCSKESSSYLPTHQLGVWGCWDHAVIASSWLEGDVTRRCLVTLTSPYA